MTSIPALETSQPPGETARERLVTSAATDGQGRAAAAGRLRTRTLILLRWLAIAGQTLAVVTVGLGLRFTLPWVACLVLIAAAAVLNLACAFSPAGRRTATPVEAAAQLAFDIVQLSALLFLTGGVANPFCLLLVAPVTVGAATLPARHAVALWALTVAAAVVLAAASLALPWVTGQGLNPPPIYRAAAAVALTMGVTFTAGFAFRVAREAARMELALHVTETVLAREQRLSALGALAAAAAHELGTPLATIAVVAKEMAREAPEGPARDDAWLLVDQAQRCRDILKRLAETPETGDVLHERMSLLQFVRETVEPYVGKTEVRVEAVVTGPAGMAAPDLWRRPEVLHAITSIVENAYDFARSEILVTARFDTETIAVEVRDDGPGFSPEVMDRLGDPYITSRPGAEGSRTGHVGMGLGFFIAKTLLERTGALVEFRNGRRASGAIVTARWPRTRMEAAELASDLLGA